MSKQIIEESFVQYAGAVLQGRALVDVRDCLKPSARQIFYSMYNRKYFSNKPYHKTAAAVGNALADFYIHGDASCEGVIMRASQGFAMRYPIIDVKGNNGSQIESGNWAASRYTECRLSPVAEAMFNGIGDHTIDEWRDSYTEEQQYPAVLPSKGFYNLVNGTMGIGIGMASSVPPFNINDVNEALIKLLWNPDISYEEIACVPDFPTGATLLNKTEVLESLKNGQGPSCRLRSVISFDSKERALVVTEIPYGVYTNTICGQLESILEDENNPGIDRFNDLTGEKPLIKIYLTKHASPDKVIKFLYKNTSLQSYYGINFTMLDHGRFPKVFTWKDTLQSFIDHQVEVYTNGFKYELEKHKARVHIIEGLLKALDMIDAVVDTIRKSNSTADASIKLRELLSIDEDQAKAILDIKLSRLAKLEINKLVNEKEDHEKEIARIEAILSDRALLNKEIEVDLRATMKKFGDARRTQVLDIVEGEEEPMEVKQIQISFTNKNNIYAHEISSLYTQKRGGVGTKFKMDKDEYIVSSCVCENTDSLLLFTKRGNVYCTATSNVPLEAPTAIEMLFTVQTNEQFCAMTVLRKQNAKKNVIFVTKNGLLKKSELSEYNLKRSKSGLKALTLDDKDEIVDVLFLNDERVGILANDGQFLVCETSSIRPIGRVARGVVGIKLNDGAEVVAMRAVTENAREIVSVSAQGLIKRSGVSEFTVQGRATKGTKIQKLNAGDSMVDFLPINDAQEITVVASSSQITLKVSDINLQSKNTLGTMSIKKKQSDVVKALCGI